MSNKKNQFPRAARARQEAFGASPLQPKALPQKSLISQPSSTEKSMKIVPEDVSTLCRLCAFKMDEMFPIFDPKDTETKIAKQIGDCLPIIVRKTNVVSNLICRLCKESLQKFHEFRNKVLKSNEKFGNPEDSLKPLENLFDSQSEGEDENYIDRESIELTCQVCSACNEVLLEGTPDADRHEKCQASTGAPNEGIRKVTLHSVYKCEFCDRSYVDGKSVKIHKASHVGNKPYVCLTCDTYYPTYHKVTAHKATHQKPSDAVIAKDTIAIPKYFSCKHCDKTFLHFANMNLHRRGCLKGQWKCRNCNNCFANSRGLLLHKRSEADKKWQCQRCPLAFGSICALRQHKKKPHSKTFTCSYCDKKFLQKTHLGIHIRGHTGEKPFLCDLCDKTFKIKLERDNHRRTHTGERPFKCSLCGKTFANAARLRDHTRYHGDEKPFKCKVCEKAFKRPGSRKIHMTIHTGEKAFKCDVCSKAFKRKTDMKKHKKTRHDVSARAVGLKPA